MGSTLPWTSSAGSGGLEGLVESGADCTRVGRPPIARQSWAPGSRRRQPAGDCPSALDDRCGWKLGRRVSRSGGRDRSPRRTPGARQPQPRLRERTDARCGPPLAPAGQERIRVHAPVARRRAPRNHAPADSWDTGLLVAVTRRDPGLRCARSGKPRARGSASGWRAGGRGWDAPLVRLVPRRHLVLPGGTPRRPGIERSALRTLIGRVRADYGNAVVGAEVVPASRGDRGRRYAEGCVCPPPPRGGQPRMRPRASRRCGGCQGGRGPSDSKRRPAAAAGVPGMGLVGDPGAATRTLQAKATPRSTGVRYRAGVVDLHRGRGPDNCTRPGSRRPAGPEPGRRHPLAGAGARRRHVGPAGPKHEVAGPATSARVGPRWLSAFRALGGTREATRSAAAGPRTDGA